MTEIQLGYGRDSLPVDFDPRKFSLLSIDSSEAPLTDVEIGEALDSPIGSPTLDDLIGSEDSVLIVVSDATRATGSAQIVNLVVRRLIQCGVSPGKLAVIFATGIHRPVSEEEKAELLTPFIVQRVRTLAHDAYGSQSCTPLGVTERGIRVEVNKALTDFSKIILIGGINFHYFAGFTGGRKSVCPGLASASTIEQTHMLALDFEKGGRRAGVGVGLLDSNPVHDECERVAELVNPTFGINTIVDENKRIVDLYCGDWRLAHRAACETYLRGHSVEIRSKRDVVVVSCGGFPHDINLIQAHKALEMASYAAKDGGTILLVAQCIDGLGRPDFLKWFESPNSIALEKRLRENYEVNGQTAWSLLTKAERFYIYLISELSDEDVQRMRMIPSKSIDEALHSVASFENGFILPRGDGILPRLADV